MAIRTVDELEARLSEPTAGVIDTLSRVQGDILILGAAGKMGPTLAKMAKLASVAAGTKRNIIAVSRFSSPGEEDKLTDAGIETIKCDIMDPDRLNGLPDAPNVVYMVGMKFGSSGAEGMTWAVNTFLPGLVCMKYRNSRIAAFSSGNIYPFVAADSGGCAETDPVEPVGEYAMSVLGRERIFQHFSTTLGIPVSTIRLNYAVELRYGVLVDIAQKVYSGEPVDVSNGYVNVIWQRDANAMTLQSFEKASAPPFVLNVAGPEFLSVREVAKQFGELMGKKPIIVGTESPSGLLSNGSLAYKLFGKPSVTAEQMVGWIAEWVAGGGDSIGKPTHFETRDGKY